MAVSAPIEVTKAPLTIAGLAWGTAAVCYLGAEALTAAAFSPGYSYAENYISDLGVPACGIRFAGRAICSPLHDLMNGDFLLQGALFLAGALALSPALPRRTRAPLIACAALNAVGIVLVGLIPETSVARGLHGLGALLAIVFGNATGFVSAFAFRTLRVPRGHRIASLTLPLVGGGALALLFAARWSGSPLLVPDGIWERASVYTITAWELVTAACLLTRAGV